MMSVMILLSSILLPISSGEPSNKHFWHSLAIEIEPAKVWQVWTAVDQWHEWDTGLKAARLKGSFKLGSRGQLTSLEGRRSKFKVVDYQEGQSYTFRTPLLFSSLYVKRSLHTASGKTSIIHEVWFKGLTAGIFANRFGIKFREMLPKVMEKVVEKANAL